MRSRAFLPRLICCLVSLCLLVGPAAANMNQVMQNMFNSMINVTPGQNFETQSAGVYAGGSIYIRNQISTIHPIVFDPPRFKADCGGIDAYAGSFSFINKDALINMMRNIASNAIPYAFKMAIGTLCPKCDNLMSELHKLSDTMNKFNINSCKAAKGPLATVQSLADTAGEMGKNLSSIADTAEGIFQDFSEGITNPVRTATAALAQANPAAASEELEYNSAWKAINDSDIAVWYISTMSSGDQANFNELVMSYTGSFINRLVVIDADGNQDVVNVPLQVRLEFEDFLKGGQNKVIWKCDTSDKCLNPTEVTVTLPSIRDSVETMLFGVSGSPGIVDKVTHRSSAGGIGLTTQEKQFIEAVPGAVYANLKHLAANRQSAKVYADAVANYLAIEMTSHLLLDVMRNVRFGTVKNAGAPRGGRDPGAAAFLEELRRREALIYQQDQAALARLEGLTKSIQLAQQIRLNLNMALASTARPTLAMVR